MARASFLSHDQRSKNEVAVEMLMTISSGAGFDLKLESLVAEQTEVRDLIGTALLPAAATAALRDELMKLRGEILTQLARPSSCWRRRALDDCRAAMAV